MFQRLASKLGLLQAPSAADGPSCAELEEKLRAKSERVSELGSV